MSTELWRDAVRVAERALASGALQPIRTTQKVVVQDGIPFLLRRMLAHTRKPAAGSSRNPFLVPEPDLIVAETEGYRVLLNKYPVVSSHLLLVTREFKPQTAPLEVEDFRVASRALEIAPSLLFFNGGSAAGASQPHCHLQLIPLPQGDAPGGFPTADRLFSDRLPWVSLSLKCMEQNADERAAIWHRFYLDALSELFGPPERQAELPPYNLLATAEGITVIPRTREKVAGISVNAMGYAGMLLVRDDEQEQALRHRKILDLLAEAALAR